MFSKLLGMQVDINVYQYHTCSRVVITSHSHAIKYHQLVLMTPTCEHKPSRVYQEQHHHSSNNHNFHTIIHLHHHHHYSIIPTHSPTRHNFNIPRAHGDITVVMIGLREMIPGQREAWRTPLADIWIGKQRRQSCHTTCFPTGHSSNMWLCLFK